MRPVKFFSAESLVQGYFFPSAIDSAKATILFLQGFPGIEGDELICEQLAQAGVHVLTFNYRGTFNSQGCFSFSHALADIGAALGSIKTSEYLQPFQIDPNKIILGGWSFGAALVPAGAVQHPAFAKIFLISGRNFGKEAQKIGAEPQYARQVARNLEGLRAPNGPVTFQDTIIPDLVAMRDLLDHEKLAPALKDRDILLLNGWDDEIVPIEEHTIPFYRALVEHGAANVRMAAVQDGHEFAQTKDQLVRIILDWIST